MKTLQYFAYGSNLHPVRLKDRVSSAKPIGITTLKGFELTFYKKSKKDHSGKCSIYETGNAKSLVYGVIYEIDENEKSYLDRIEGKGSGYNEITLDLKLDHKTYNPSTYIADADAIDYSILPYDWYKKLVLVGAKYHLFPDEYISFIENIPSIPDPDQERNSENISLLKKMIYYNEHTIS